MFPRKISEGERLCALTFPCPLVGNAYAEVNLASENNGLRRKVGSCAIFFLDYGNCLF